MLVLARKIDESIVLGDNIIVKVVSIENGSVKLGIEAPQSISIVRNELVEEIKERNIAAVHKLDDEEIDGLSKILNK
jgi:carbon storage regulator CsrA